MTRFDDVDARCPFFISSDRLKITCEGVTDGCSTILGFNSEPKKEKYKKNLYFWRKQK